MRVILDVIRNLRELLIYGVLFSPFSAVWGAVDIEVQATSAILINAKTGAILYEKNPHEKLYPSSITKVATALYTLDQQGHKLDKMLTADQDCIGWTSEEAKKRSNYTLPAYWLENGGTHMNLKKGETLSLEALLYGLLLVSANDAANVIAQHVGGTIPDFMNAMNLYLKELGCLNTNFSNPHGLHHPQHQTTAYDMALITRHALANPTFSKIVATTSYTRPKTNVQDEGTLVQGNMLLRRGKHYYPKAIGVKTGGTRMAKNCLVSAATDHGRTLIAVLMKSQDREAVFADSKRLFEAAFKEPKETRQLMPEGLLHLRPQSPENNAKIYPYLKKAITYDYFPSEKPTLKCLVEWGDLALPIVEDQQIGAVVVQTTEGAVIQRVPVFSKYAVQEGFWRKFKRFFQSGEKSASPFVKVLGGFSVLAFIVLFSSQIGKKSNRRH